MAALNERNGARPLNRCILRATFVLLTGCRRGHTMSTVNPAWARAIARRAVGYQQKVVATRTLGFIFTQTSYREKSARTNLEIFSRAAPRLRVCGSIRLRPPASGPRAGPLRRR